MSNLGFGILTVLLCFIGYYFAYKSFKQNNYTSAILLILLCGLFLRIFISADLYLHTWDERYHALVAKNLINHPLTPTLRSNPLLPYDYKNWVDNHIWLEKPPIPLWSMAISMSIFGVNEIAARIPSILVSLLGIYLTFLIGQTLFNKKVGLLAAFLHSINGLLIELAGGRVSSDHVETFFIFFVQLSVFLSIYAIKNKKSYTFSLLIGIVTAFSLLSKWNPGLLVIPLWFVGAYFSRQYTLRKLIFNLFLIILSTFSVFSIWIIYIFNHFPEEAKWVLTKFVFAFNKSLEGHDGPIYFYINQAGIIFGEIVFIPLILSIYFLFRKKISWKLILLTAWWLIPLVIFSFAETKRQTYLLISAPAFFILTAYFMQYLFSIRLRFRYKFILNLILILLILLPIRYSIERIKPFEKRERNPLWAQQIRNINNLIPWEKKLVLFNIERPIETMFYTDFIAYSQIPNPETIESLQKRGFTIIINEDSTIDIEQFANNKEILFLKLTSPRTLGN